VRRHRCQSAWPLWLRGDCDLTHGGKTLTRPAPQPITEDRSLRLRAAWLAYHRGLTQSEIAERLKISRSSVIRLLEEVRARAEVQIWIDMPPGELADLAAGLEERFGLERALVVPGDGTAEETAQDVGAALGRFLSEKIAPGMTVGIGWGRTLDAALTSFRAPRMAGVRIVSLLGGVVEVRGLNPMDVAWRMAGALGAECLLFPAPLIVDSAETKRRLLEDCGLNRIVEVARGMDLAVVSCGDIGAAGSSLSQGFLSAEDYRGLVAAGAVCDTMCHFLDSGGASVAHPLQERVMSVGLDVVARAGHVVIASGGARRAAAIRATIARVGCQTLVTDEAAARVLLEM
jgi:DNA-binding transcriptional regulator LsrR (DeoR family)